MTYCHRKGIKTLFITVTRNLGIILRVSYGICFDRYLLLQATILSREKTVLGQVVFTLHACWLYMFVFRILEVSFLLPQWHIICDKSGFVSCTSTHFKNILQILISEDSSFCLHGNKKYVQKFVIPDESRLLGRPMQMWEDNIKMDLRETGCASADWVELLLL